MGVAGLAAVAVKGVDAAAGVAGGCVLVVAAAVVRLGYGGLWQDTE